MPNYKEFQSDYEQNAILQKGFNSILIDDFIAYIHRVIPHALKQPIKILDICCGDGGISATLFDKLEKSGIQITSFVGYDISEAQIAIAQEKYGKIDDRLVFKNQDATQITDTNEYDVIISLFGFHWIDSLDHLASLISQALKPGGKLFYFVPLEKNDFFDIRKKLIETKEWSPHFSDFYIKKFADNSKPYIDAFKAYFQFENEDGIDGQQDIEYTSDNFLQFVSSWMPELRELTSELKIRYMQDLLMAIPTFKDRCQNVTKNDSLINFRERFFWFHGTKSIDHKQALLESNPASQKH